MSKWIRLTGAAYDEGKSGTVASFGTMLFISGLGFLIHGTSGQLPSGTAVQAYLAEPLQFMWSPPASTAVAMLPAEPDAADPAKPGFSTLN